MPEAFGHRLVILILWLQATTFLISEQLFGEQSGDN